MWDVQVYSEHPILYAFIFQCDFFYAKIYAKDVI